MKGSDSTLEEAARSTRRLLRGNAKFLRNLLITQAIGGETHGAHAPPPERAGNDLARQLSSFRIQFDLPRNSHRVEPLVCKDARHP